MFIKTLDNKKLLNTAQITSFEIVEPKHDLKKYLICANMFRDGGIIAEAETEAEAEDKLHCIYNQVNGK